MHRRLKVLHIGKYFAPFSGGVENYQRDAMIALANQGILSAGLVHQHKTSLKNSEESLEANGLVLPIVRVATWFKLLFTPVSPDFPRQLSRLIKSFEPDILHLHMPNPSVFWALFLPAAKRLPWVVHWHADVITDQQDWKMKFIYQLYRPFERAVLKRASAIIATSPPYLGSSHPLRNWQAKCHVVPLGAEPSRLLDAAKYCQIDNHQQKNKHALRVLAIGRLTYYKGFKYLIKAAASAPDIQIHIVGSGDQEQELMSLAVSLHVDKQVTFHGSLSNQQLAAQMALSDCVCLPSIERTEAFGMVLLEAQSFAKATVVSDVPGSGMGWVVDHEVTGLKVPPEDAEALAAAFNAFHNDRESMATMGHNGLLKFQKEFDIRRSIKKLIAVYAQVSDVQSRQE